jgi:hypothetical protein
LRLMLPPCKVSARCGRGERGVEAGAVTLTGLWLCAYSGAEGRAERMRIRDGGEARQQDGKGDVRVQERSESVSAEI